MSRQNDGFEFKLSWYQRLLSAIFRVVNIFVSWDRLGKLIGAVNIATLRDRLRRDNLHHAGYGVQAATPWVAGNERWRSADGSYNSLDHARMGMAGSRFARNVPLSEAIPDSGAALLDPSPRVISRELMARETFQPATTLNLLAAAWIQFETHDWFSHGQPIENDPDPHKIPLPPGDDWPDAISGRMHIRRSRRDPTPREPWLGGTPTFVNDNSHWWDAAQLYSSDRKRQERIRSGTDGTIRLGGRHAAGRRDPSGNRLHRLQRQLVDRLK